MDKLIEDSKYIQSLLENDNLIENDDIIKYFPNVNFDLLIDYYNGDDNENLVKLANDMNLLDCGKLEEVLIKIRRSGIVFDDLNPDLITEINELNKFVKIACGLSHTLALRKDSSLSIWGGDEEGQRNNFPTSNDFVEIACGCVHSVALRKDGSVVAWGCNSEGQINYPTGNDYIAISCGDFHSIALRKNGSIASWGNNIPKIWETYVECTKITSGYTCSCILHSKGTNISIWGYGIVKHSLTNNKYVTIACGEYHFVALLEDGTLKMFGDSKHGQRQGLPNSGYYINVVCGQYHSVALQKDGTIATWGGNSYNQISDFIQYENEGFTAIACGDHHSVALREDGSIITWGGGVDQKRDSPKKKGYIAISCGKFHSVAIHQDGSVTTWGCNTLNQRKDAP